MVNGQDKSTMDILRIVLDTLIDDSGVALPTVAETFSFKNIVGPQSLVLKTGPTVLHTVNVQIMNGGTTSAKIYNAVTAVPTNLIASFNNTSSPGSFLYKIEAPVGLFIVTVGNNVDVTVTYA